MATAYTSLLGLALPVTGELSGSWGDTVNTAITSLLDNAVAGTTSITADADITLTTTTGAANQARQAIILWNPASGTVTRNITAPAQSKIYTVINASGGTQSIVFRGAGPTTGVTIIKGESAVVAWNGTDFIKVSNTGGAGSFTNVTISGTTTLSGLTASTALALDASKNVVSVTNTGTGNNVLSASPTLTGTITAAAANFSGAVALGDAAADNITVNGTVTSNLLFTDNTYDIGASGATRPRNLFLAGNATVGGNLLVGYTADQGSGKLQVNGAGRIGAFDFNTDDITYVGGGNFQIGTVFGLPMLFKTSNAERMRITSAGNVGIGTSSPDSRLTVSAAGDTTIKIAPSSAGTARLNLNGIGGGAAAITSAENGLYLANTDAAPFVFSINSTERMRLDSAGNLGLGIVPSTWFSNRSVLQIGNSVGVVAASGLNFDQYTNGYIDASTVERYYQAGAANKFSADSGSFKWFTAASGTANAAIAFTQAMTLNASGNLGIGTTAPTLSLNIGDSTLPAGVAITGAMISTDAGGGSLLSVRRSAATGNATIAQFTSSGTASAPTAVVNNRGLGRNEWYGFDGTNYVAAAAILAAVDGTPGTNSMPGRMIFQTSASGSGSPTERMRIDSSGNLGIGTTAPGDKLEIGGAGAGIILASPNGTRYRITVSNAGALTVAAA
jgi:hypothetical protein